jgi:hypothetical protein
MSSFGVFLAIRAFSAILSRVFLPIKKRVKIMLPKYNRNIIETEIKSIQAMVDNFTDLI